MIHFEWDEAKNRANRKKHGVWFEEAIQVFNDSCAINCFDEIHSQSEDRYILLGISGSMRLLVVIYCEKSEQLLRIISARKATKKESGAYEKGI